MRVQSRLRPCRGTHTEFRDSFGKPKKKKKKDTNENDKTYKYIKMICIFIQNKWYDYCFKNWTCVDPRTMGSSFSNFFLLFFLVRLWALFFVFPGYIGVTQAIYVKTSKKWFWPLSKALTDSPNAQTLSLSLSLWLGWNGLNKHLKQSASFAIARGKSGFSFINTITYNK